MKKPKLIRTIVLVNEDESESIGMWTHNPRHQDFWSAWSKSSCAFRLVFDFLCSSSNFFTLPLPGASITWTTGVIIVSNNTHMHLRPKPNISVWSLQHGSCWWLDSNPRPLYCPSIDPCQWKTDFGLLLVKPMIWLFKQPGDLVAIAS